MKILHVVTGLDVASGGPSASIFGLVNGLKNCNIDTQIIATQTKNSKNISDEKFIKYFTINEYLGRFAFSPTIKNYLKLLSHIQIIHTHGLWQYPTHIACTFSRKRKIPYVISPRGMLYPDALKISSGIKRMALFLFQLKDLKYATVIHATSFEEMKHIRNLGFNNPIAIIPNSIELSSKLKKEKNSKKRRLAFIGRLHEIKNIESLIKAWKKVHSKNTWELVVVGDGEPNYVNKLKKLVIELEMSSIVTFTGFLTGTEKENFLKTLDIVVLPSFSENFGMVVGEALMNEIPVIASTGTPWEDLHNYKCGWWIKNDVETLAQTIQQAISLSDEERRLMGQRGRLLIKEKYSIDIVAMQMIQLYKWILNGGKKPEFVYL